MFLYPQMLTQSPIHVFVQELQRPAGDPGVEQQRGLPLQHDGRYARLTLSLQLSLLKYVHPG